MAKAPPPPAEPTVTFWGAARTVTGSMHQLTTGNKTILLDCGLFQGKRSESYLRNRDFPFRTRDIDAVVLSHAHVDHCGNLPNLVRRGFAGPIYCTPATRALAAVMLGDAAKIQEEDANYLNHKRARHEPKITPLFDARDVFRTLTKMQAVRYGERFTLSKGIEVTFADAGHLLGSATVHLRLEGPNGERRVTFTGDVGRPGLPILRDPEPIPACDLLISESTYGGHTHEHVDETADKLGEVVRRTIERGGRVIIPAFAVGRTQTVVYFLHQLISSGKLPPIPIFVDSPMANRATEVFRAHTECFDEETLALLNVHPDLFGEKHVRYVETVNESVKLNRREGPCVVISASGMCEAGRILHHLKHGLGDPRNTILIAGYQATDTLGRRLVEKRPEVRVLGRPCPVKAEVVVLNGLSSHADHGDMLRMLGPLAASTSRVRLVHGEPERATKLVDGLKEIGFADVSIPERGETVVV
ncbi:Ribonuclease [Gemmata sp. SH-PL17]|uniref:MBL fold metallo-hydrolase n=1 Tax=Gemmata sp. SH-PL17 TaxID=1630693 RepID=UPI00078D9744|nr:MBL fold metallo-hydrolase [Gemmata sp. SH-PL17]AMV29818.1 Ribonuclease [Gemmata sp. SH-PL17]